MEEELLEILGCPFDQGELEYDGEKLICRQCGRVYEIEDGIPVMLVDRDSYSDI